MAAKIYIVYYSTYGHVAKLADEIHKGVSSVQGVDVKLWQRLKVTVKMKRYHPNIRVQGHIIFKGFLLIQGRGFLFQSMMSMIKMKFGDDTLQRKQSNHMHTTFKSVKSMVPETLSDEALAKMGAPPKRDDVPVISPAELADADGLIFGFPTRFGMMPTQFKAFMDGTSELWCPQRLAGKPAALFFSSGCQGGGQETTALTAITQLVHHGMLFVPVGYTFGAGMFEMGQVKGGSPYGSGTIAGDGSRVPTELELQQAFHQGKYFAGIAKKLKGSP